MFLFADNSACTVHGIKLRIILLIRFGLQFRLCELLRCSVTVLGHSNVLIISSTLVDYNINGSGMRSAEVRACWHLDAWERKFLFKKKKLFLSISTRYLFRVISTTIWPDDATRAFMEQRQAQRRGEELLVAWSRSTSASSIYRY